MIAEMDDRCIADSKIAEADKPSSWPEGGHVARVTGSCWPNAIVGVLIVADPVEYCPWETFKATCKEDEVIAMETARYGRMRLGRCVKNDLGYVGCFTDVLYLGDR